MPRTLIAKKLSQIIEGDLNKVLDSDPVTDAINTGKKVAKTVKEKISSVITDTDEYDTEELTWMERRRLDKK